MSNERKKGRSLLAKFMVLLMIINLLNGINPSAVMADSAIDAQHFENNGKQSEDSGITLIETAKNYDNGKFDVEMLIKSSGNITTTQDKMDVVLVIDRSASMGDNNKMLNTKNAAKGFVKALLKNKNVNIGLVSFGGRHRITNGTGPMLDSLPITGDENSLLNTINNYKPYDGLFDGKRRGTFTQAGLKKANELFKNAGHKRAIILITDGEPTYAYKTEPDFGVTIDFEDVTDDSVLKYTHQVWSIGKDAQGILDKDKRRMKLGKHSGTYSTGRGSNKKNWTYHPYYVELKTNYGKYIGGGDRLTDDVRIATLAESGRLKKSGVDIYAIGIGVNEIGKGVLGEIASQNGYYDSNMSAGDLDNILSKLKHVFKEYAIENGTVKVKMNSQVTFEGIDNLVFEGKNNNVAATEEDKNELDDRVKKIQKKWDVTNKVLTLSNVTLGKDEELSIKYKAKLSENWMDDTSYQISETAELLPKGNPNKLVSFIIPMVKDKKTVNITVNKKWVGDKVPDSVNELKFEVTPKTPTENYNITVKKDENWTGKIENLPKYKNGTKIEYKVEETAGNDYEKVGEITKTELLNGDLTFEAKNRSIKKVNLTVEKKWDAPEDVKDNVKVEIYKGNETTSVRTVEIDKEENSPVPVNGLDKYDEQGNEIVYRVQEAGTTADGKVKLANGKEFIPTVSNNGNAWVITNKYANTANDTFTATLTKTWIGGISTKDVTFTFTNIAANKKYILTLKAADFAGNTEWNGTIDLPKYNADNNAAVYSVTEGEVKGFTLENKSPDSVSAVTPNVSFTNTRNTKNITVTKIWKDTPDSLKTDVEVVLYENGQKSNRADAIKKIEKSGNSTVEYTGLPVTDEAGNEINYTVKENNFNSILFSSEVKADADGDFVITNTYTKLKEDTISVTLVKEWFGGVGRNATFKFTNATTGEVAKELILKADTTGVIVAENNGRTTWEITVSDLRKYDDNAKPIQYKVSEVIGNKAFELQSDNDVAFNNGGTVKFTNTRVVRMLTLNKKWAGPAAEKAVFKITPSDKRVELDASKNWKDAIDLPVYDLDGNTIEYTVTEDEVKGYKAKEKEQKISFVDPANMPGNRELTFTNVKLLENNFIVNKTWKGTPAERVSFGVFDENNNKIDTLTLTKDDALQVGENIWKGQFKGNIFAYDSAGKLIKYVVKELDENGNPVDKEVNLGNRTYRITGTVAQGADNTYNFTNVDVTAGDIKITKTWVGTVGAAEFGLFIKDSDEQITAKPEVLVQPAPDKFEVVFKGIKLTDDNGNAVEYEIKELGANGEILKTGDHVTIGNKKYEVSYDQNGNITNKELIDITVKKVWDDSVPMSERQSAEIAVFNGQTEVNYATLEAGLIHDNSGLEWQYTFTDLPYVENGYTVKETAINDVEVEAELAKLYDIKVDKENIKETTTVTITNSFKLSTPAENKIKVVKQWMVNPDNKEITVKVFKKTIGTPNEPSKWVATDDLKKLSGSYVLETEFNKPEDVEDYYVLETAIDDAELTEDEIQTILNSNNLETAKYKIGEYDVLVKKLKDRVFFIKNSNDKELTEITVEKQWSKHTLKRYIQPVKVQLYSETNGILEAIGSPVELNSAKWKTRFKGLDKYDDNGNEIKYHVAEVAVADVTKNDITLSDIQNGYKIGKYDVAVDGDGTENIVIRNDVNLIDITARKDWGTVSESNRKPVEFTLYSRMGDELKEVTGQILTGAGGNWTTEFKDQPRVDENGEEFTYYVFETKIDGTEVGIDPLTGSGYTFDPFVKKILYTTGTINNGKYSVVILGNAANNEIVIKNSFTANSSGDPVVPIIPGLDPGTVTPDPTPGTTPTLDVADDTTPQGAANTDNNADADDTGDDGFVELDEDETPQGKANVKDNTGTDDAKRKETTDIEEDETPQGHTALPKTGGTARDFFGIIGMGLVGLGLIFKKRKH